MYVNAATFGVTNNCNLACEYCFERLKRKTRMSLETARKAVDWLLRDDVSGPVARVDITFFGGEPLIEFERIRKIVSYAKDSAEAAGKTVGFNATSNGTLFTEKVADFWRENEMGFLLSCDGIPQAHDAHRVTLAGKGSYALIERNLENILSVPGAREVRMTVMPDTTRHMADGVRFLADLGFEAIAVFHVEEASWTKDQLYEFQEQFYEVGEFYTRAIEAGRKLSVGPLDRILRLRLNGSEGNDRDEGTCGAGRGYIGIAHDGILFPCHRFFTANGFKGAFPIGDIDSGLDDARRMAFLRVKRRLMLGCDVDCKDCPARSYCSGGCMAANYDVTGHLLFRPPTARYFEIIWWSVAGSILDYFKENGIERLQSHFDEAPSTPC